MKAVHEDWLRFQEAVPYLSSGPICGQTPGVGVSRVKRLDGLRPYIIDLDPIGVVLPEPLLVDLQENLA